MKFRLNTIPLHDKITFLVCVVAVVISSCLGYYAYHRIYDLSYEKAIDKLATDTRLMSGQVSSQFTRIYDDLLIISGTPPFSGIIRSKENLGIDPKDGSSEDVWKSRLSEIFFSVMEERPYYMQMRYIGLSDNGKELVRVNRSDEDLVIVSDPELQEKIGEPYMLNLDGLLKDHVYFSDVTFNRENGKIDTARLPTLRAITPIFSGSELFGIFIININYPEFVKGLVKGFLPNHDMYLVNDQEDYLMIKPSGEILPFEYHEEYSKQPPKFISALNDGFKNNHFVDNEEHIAYYAKIQMPGHEEMKHFGVVFQATYDDIMFEAIEARNNAILLSAIFILISGIGSYVLARNFVKPFREMTKSIASFKSLQEELVLPDAGSLELKELAQAFEVAVANLKESEDMANVILETASDGIISINSQGIISRFNKSAEHIFGYSPAEIIGHNVKVLMPGNHRDQHDNYLQNYKETGVAKIMGSEREVIGIRSSGEEIPLAVSISEVKTKKGSEFTAIIRDLTYRKETEDRLNDLLAELKRSNADLDEFAYVASHDLKAPLRVIDNASSWLEEDLDGQLDEESQENLALLRGRVKRMENLLDDLLEYSRVGKTKDQRYDEVINGCDLLNDILFMLNPPEQFSVTADEEFKNMLFHRMPVYQILYNLINNAIKHHHVDNGKISITVSSDKGRKVCKVTDDGPGIEERYFDKIFQVFQTLKPRDQVEGSGMGLSIIKKHVESYKGEVGVNSVLGEGTTFWFTLPLVKDKSPDSIKM
ncbi:sensor histidine kinase [Marinoscillum pacificum]|uniref:sensor histidine kinase n=1 Tax=Marinoscillum pacificum TaxID=392723 RepID=UPI0021575A23|nr:PAS domain S-box protein [Marinoscillum pacificum]